jgi:hypothetical protein
MTVGMVSMVRVPSGTSSSMMGSVVVTTLHPRGPEAPRIPLVLKVVTSSPKDSSRVVHGESDLVWAIPMNMASESRPWGRDLGGQADR